MWNLLALHFVNTFNTSKTRAMLTKKTTETFSFSTTPASGSASISSPGPGIAGFILTVSVDLFLFILTVSVDLFLFEDFKEAKDTLLDAVEVNDLIELMETSVIFRASRPRLTWYHCSASRRPVAATPVSSIRYLLDHRTPVPQVTARGYVSGW